MDNRKNTFISAFIWTLIIVAFLFVGSSFEKQSSISIVKDRSGDKVTQIPIDTGAQKHDKQEVATTTKDVVDIKEAPKEVVADIAPTKTPVPQENTNFVTIETVNSLINLLNQISDTNTGDNSAPTSTSLSFSEINTKARDSLVNIVCTTKTGGSFNPISGSGIIIDPRGIILTNAHVAEYYLVRDYITPGWLDCVIRTGSPASAKYRADPIYISEKWINDNANLITETNPKGTGENDYALLVITSTTDPNKTLPNSFPFIPLGDSDILGRGESVFIGGYPAGFLSGISIQKDLYITSTISRIADLFTFGDGALDLITVDGSILAQKGASGGSVINDKEEVVSIIVTSTSADSTGDRILGAITVGHINRSLKTQTGKNLSEFLTGNLDTKINKWKTITAPPLEKLLFDVLDR